MSETVVYQGNKGYLYECVMDCSVGYMAPDQRKERIKPGVTPENVMHEITFRASDGYSLPEYLFTQKRLARHYTDVIEHVVNRKDFVNNTRVDRVTHTKIKFRLIDSDEMSGLDRSKVKIREVHLRDMDCDHKDEVA